MVRKIGIWLLALAPFAAAGPLFAKPPILTPVVLPDLSIADLHMSTTSANTIDKIYVTLAETCGVAPGAIPDVQISIYNAKGGALLGGKQLWPTGKLAAHASVALVGDFAASKFPATSYVLATADGTNWVKEDDEGNNTASLNPDAFPFPSGVAHCKPRLPAAANRTP